MHHTIPLPKLSWTHRSEFSSQETWRAEVICHEYEPTAAACATPSLAELHSILYNTPRTLNGTAVEYFLEYSRFSGIP